MVTLQFCQHFKIISIDAQANYVVQVLAFWLIPVVEL